MSVFESGEGPPRILIADDDPSVIRLLADRCSLMGFEVETAPNGTRALMRVRQGGFDTLIIDVHMPELDGLAVCKSLVESSLRPAHMIVATGCHDAETIAKCDALGALYVRKGAAYWENLETALVGIYSADVDRIKRFDLRSTRAAMPRRSRILLVDDDPDIENFLREELDELGVDILYALDAAQGYRVARREEPTAIVCNYSLPNRQTQYLLTRLRTTPATRNVPFIVLSPEQLDATDEQSLKREIGGAPGASRILRKSADTSELLATLRKFCGFRPKRTDNSVPIGVPA
jgi:CheY-like chemotaxis protein